MFIVEKGETLVLRLLEPVSMERVRKLTDHLSELSKGSGVLFVLLDYSLEPCAIQKVGRE